jgi:hypothetical protein
MPVCVNRRLPTTIAARLGLMDAVVTAAAEAAADHPVFVALPAGFFGFDADIWQEESGDPWTGLALSAAETSAVCAHAQSLVDRLPNGSAMTFGSDLGKANSDQAVWVIKRGEVAREIRRTSTPLSARHVQVGPLRATVFVCGEFTGSERDGNGPFFEDEYLEVDDLDTTGLLVDVAHAHVKGTIDAAKPNPRWVHEVQMVKFAKTKNMGAATLTHHHGGELTDGRPVYDAQSSWVLYRGGSWIGDLPQVRICTL